MIKTKFEIREQTLKNVSWEIHDNIGQILSTLNFLNYSILDSAPKELKPKIEESQILLDKAISEIRLLSKSLNTDYIKSIGWLEVLKLEFDRMQRLKFLQTTFEINGKQIPISEEAELILLRIVQEFISNSLKHSKSKNLKLTINFKQQEVQIIAKDDGIGFDRTTQNGTGLINLKSRARIIGAQVELNSQPNQGTELILNFISKLN